MHYSQELPSCSVSVATATTGHEQRECLHGRYVKAADKEIIAAVKAQGRLVEHQTFTHSYPFCWRSETPLIYRVRSTAKYTAVWFVADLDSAAPFSQDSQSSNHWLSRCMFPQPCFATFCFG